MQESRKETAGATAESQLRLLVESVRDYAIFMLDSAGHVMTWNLGAQNIKGYARDEIFGRHIEVFYTPEDRAVGKPNQLLELAAERDRIEDEGWRVRKDGTRFWANVVITALRDPSGELLGFGKVTRDLTARKEAEERLRRAEEILEATLYSIGDAVLATDEAARVTMINPVAEQLTGWKEAEAVGRPVEEVFDIINEYSRVKAVSPVERVLREGVVVGLANHTALVARDKTEHPIADSGAPIRDHAGNTIGVVLVFRDVTGERMSAEALRQSEERLRLMIASIQGYAVFMLDTVGKIASWNPGAERITGYRAEEVLGADFSLLFTSEDVAAGKPQRELAVASEQGRFEDESWRMRKDGSCFWANVVISAIHDDTGRLVGFAKVTRDLTERRKLEEERIRLAQAREGIRLRDEFLSIASHELKTPLTALQLRLQAMREMPSLAEGSLEQKLNEAIRSGERMSDLIETILDVSRIATGELTLKRAKVDLVTLVAEVVARMREAARRSGCQVSIRPESSVHGQWDLPRIEQVLANLLGNAFKHAPNSTVEVVVRRQADLAVLEVRDSGPGLRDSDIPRLFRRFERAAPTGYGGMGLGLYVARQIAEAHGGTVSASNRPEGGASFVVTLPLDAPGSLESS